MVRGKTYTTGEVTAVLALYCNVFCTGEGGVENCDVLVCEGYMVRPEFNVPCVPQVKKKNMTAEDGMHCFAS
jgi:hypothetical protein